MKKIVFALSAVSLLAASAPSLAAPCKDAKGKFVKCPAKPPRPRSAAMPRATSSNVLSKREGLP